MKLPVISGKEAVKAFEKLGYAPVRQKGSHIRMKHLSDASKTPISIPNHKVLGKGLLPAAGMAVEIYNSCFGFSYLCACPNIKIRTNSEISLCQLIKNFNCPFVWYFIRFYSCNK